VATEILPHRGEDATIVVAQFIGRFLLDESSDYILCFSGLPSRVEFHKRKMITAKQIRANQGPKLPERLTASCDSQKAA